MALLGYGRCFYFAVLIGSELFIMCGIVGLFLKDTGMQSNLGQHLTNMLVTMTDRGPDSAGIAVYHQPNEGVVKITLQSDHPQTAFAGLDTRLQQALENSAQGEAASGSAIKIVCKYTHAVLSVPD